MLVSWQLLKACRSRIACSIQEFNVNIAAPNDIIITVTKWYKQLKHNNYVELLAQTSDSIVEILEHAKHSVSLLYLQPGAILCNALTHRITIGSMTL